MGRTQTIGHELGVEMEELEAALITVTIGGVKANEAATQIRGIMSALLKPSQAMTAALHSIGVESGPAAIATWKLGGTIQTIAGGHSRHRGRDGGPVPERVAAWPVRCGSQAKGRTNMPRAWKGLRGGRSDAAEGQLCRVHGDRRRKGHGGTQQLQELLHRGLWASVVKEMEALVGGDGQVDRRDAATLERFGGPRPGGDCRGPADSCVCSRARLSRHCRQRSRRGRALTDFRAMMTSPLKGAIVGDTLGRSGPMIARDRRVTRAVSLRQGAGSPASDGRKGNDRRRSRRPTRRSARMSERTKSYCRASPISR